MKSDTEQTMKFEQLYKISSKFELNSSRDSSVGYSIRMEVVVVGSNPTQANFLELLKNCLQGMNIICISSFRYTHVITSKNFLIKINVVTDEGNSRNKIWLQKL